MKNISSKIRKLTRALEVKGKIYLVNREQFYSTKKQKVCTTHKLSQLLPIEEYNKLNPDDKKDPKKYEYVKIEVLKSFSEIDILMKLVDIYQEVGGADG